MLPMTETANTERTEPPESPKSFEESLGELRTIVGELEEGSLGLEDSLRRFEEGMTLLRNCYRVLEQAEQKIEILTGVDTDGEPLTEPFDARATAEQSGKSAGRRKQSSSARKQAEQTAAPEQDVDDSAAGPRLFS